MANKKKNLGEEEIRRITAEHSNSISLHDHNNNILLNFEGVKVANLVGMNASEIGSAYNWSPSKQALLTGEPVTGIVDTKYGGKQIVSANPIKGKDGKVLMVVVTAIDKSVIDMYEDVIGSPNSQERLLEITKDFLSNSNFSDSAIVSESAQMKQVITTAKAVASSDSSVMLVGSSGTGKDVIARYIHRHSLRAERALVPVNCAAIPAELMESEFFGYVKGAFTGANPEGKAGLFELADRGTLFLDEIGDLPLGMQTKLLRVLETGEVTRLGATKPITVDVRLISATNRDLQELIKTKQFRSDLYFRINVIPITLSNLKDRPEDILPLADGILNELNKRYGQNKVLAEQTKEKLLSYDWPGNVRELRNVVERMLITQLSDELVLDDNYLESGDGSTAISEYPVTQAIPTGSGSLKKAMAHTEKAYIKRALDAVDGNVAKAAEALDIHRSILYRKMTAYNIKNK